MHSWAHTSNWQISVERSHVLTCFYVNFPISAWVFFSKNEKLLKMKLICYPLFCMYFHFKIAQFFFFLHQKVKVLENCFHKPLHSYIHFYIKFWHNLAFVKLLVFIQLCLNIWILPTEKSLIWSELSELHMQISKNNCSLLFQAKRH